MIDKRTLRDTSLAKTKALPAANASNTSDVLDLTSVNPGRTAGDQFELLVELPATPSLVDTKKVTLTIEDSADNSTFAAVADLPVITVTGAGGAGGTAVEHRFTPPASLRRYIRLAQTVEASGGDNTAKSATLSLVF